MFKVIKRLVLLYYLYFTQQSLFMVSFPCICLHSRNLKTNENIKSFQKYLNGRSNHSCEIVKQKIKDLDSTGNVSNEGTYENGCKFLLSWYNSLRQD